MCLQSLSHCSAGSALVTVWVLARAVMLDWDYKFDKVIQKSSINRKMNKRYVDDQVGVYKTLAPGAKWCSNIQNFVIEDPENDTRLPDHSTMDVVRDAANTVSSHIIMTSDCPSDNIGGKMPVLDIQCWIEGGEVRFEHYRKPMCSDRTLLSDSALPARVKRNTHSQEVVCMLRNCHDKVPWERKAEILTSHMARLKASGYGHKYRCEVLTSGLKGYRKMQAVQEAGGRHVNRHDSQDHVARKIRKIMEPKTWYKTGGHSTVLFVPATPNSELANRLREKEQTNSQGRDWSVKIVETSGRTLKSSLQRADPTPKTPCNNNNCMCCNNGNLGQCSKEGAVYRIHCTNENCGKDSVRYWGESGRTLNLRQQEHLKGLEKRKQDSPLWQHCLQEHNSQEQKFAIKLVSRHQEPLTRLIKEGVVISRDDPDLRLNSRTNYRQPKVSRTLRVRDLGDVHQSNLRNQAPNNTSGVSGTVNTTSNTETTTSQVTAATTAAAALAAAAGSSQNDSNSLPVTAATAAAATTAAAASRSHRDNNNLHNNSSSQGSTVSSSSNSSISNYSCSSSSQGSSYSSEMNPHEISVGGRRPPPPCSQQKEKNSHPNAAAEAGTQMCHWKSSTRRSRLQERHWLLFCVWIKLQQRYQQQQ